MAPELVIERLPGLESGKRILDPMVGSGTTLATARRMGYETHGIDRDPLAVLIAKAWCSDLDTERYRAEAVYLLDQAKIISKKLCKRDWYPPNVDSETAEFIRSWFDPCVRRQLASLVIALSSPGYEYKNFLKVTISRMIITKQFGVSLAWDVSHSRPHRKYDKAPITPFEFFLKNVDAVCKRAKFSKPNGFPKSRIAMGDCRKVDYPDEYFDYIITSPPYLNAIDYLRGHRLSLVWFGHSVSEIRELRGTNIGAERGIADDALDNILQAMVTSPILLTTRLQNMIRRYLFDLNAMTTEMRRVSRVGARVIFVIGDCTIAGSEVRNSTALKYISRDTGLELSREWSRPIEQKRRYLPISSSSAALSNRMREETILEFVRL